MIEPIEPNDEDIALLKLLADGTPLRWRHAPSGSDDRSRKSSFLRNLDKYHPEDSKHGEWYNDFLSQAKRNGMDALRSHKSYLKDQLEWIKAERETVRETHRENESYFRAVKDIVDRDFTGSDELFEVFDDPENQLDHAFSRSLIESGELDLLREVWEETAEESARTLGNLKATSDLIHSRLHVLKQVQWRYSVHGDLRPFEDYSEEEQSEITGQQFTERSKDYLKAAYTLRNKDFDTDAPLEYFRQIGKRAPKSDGDAPNPRSVLDWATNNGFYEPNKGMSLEEVRDRMESVATDFFSKESEDDEQKRSE